MNRQKLVLFLLLLVLAGSIAFSVLRSPKQQRAAAPKYAPGAVAQVTAGKGATLPKPGADDSKLHLEILNRELPRFNGYRRNIFRPVFREEVKVPPFKPLPPPPRPVKMPPPQPLPANALPPAPPSPEQIADSELAKFTFLGYLDKNGEKTVFLSSNHEIFLAKKGSNLGSRFQVTGLYNDAITIKSVTGGREMVIPLVENRALSTRRTQ